MPNQLEAKVVFALTTIRNPRLDQDIFSAGMIKDLVVDDDGKVSFTFLLSKADPATLVREARKAVTAVEGVVAAGDLPRIFLVLVEERDRIRDGRLAPGQLFPATRDRVGCGPVRDDRAQQPVRHLPHAGAAGDCPGKSIRHRQ